MMGTLGIIAFLLIAFGVRSYVSNEVLSKRPSRLDQFYFGALITFIVIWLFSNSPFYSLLDYNRYIPFKEFASQIKLQEFLSYVYRDGNFVQNQYKIGEIFITLLRILGTLLPISLSFVLLSVKTYKRRFIYGGLILILLVFTYSDYPLGTLIVLYLFSLFISFCFKWLVSRNSNHHDETTDPTHSKTSHIANVLKVIPLVAVCCLGLYISWPTFSSQFDVNYASHNSNEMETRELETADKKLVIPSKHFSMTYTEGIVKSDGEELELNFFVDTAPRVDFPYTFQERSINFTAKINGERRGYSGNYYMADSYSTNNNTPSENEDILKGVLSLRFYNYDVSKGKPLPIENFELLGIDSITFSVNDSNLLNQFRVIDANWTEDEAGYPNYEVTYRIPKFSEYDLNWYIFNEGYPTEAFYSKMSYKMTNRYSMEEQRIFPHANKAILISENNEEEVYRVNYYYYDQYQGILTENDIKSMTIKPMHVFYTLWSETAYFEEPLHINFTE